MPAPQQRQQQTEVETSDVNTTASRERLTLSSFTMKAGGWTTGNVMIIAFVFVVLPSTLGLLFFWLFEEVLHLTKSEYYALNFT